MYDTEGQRRDEEQHHGEMADTDCTWISRSVLQRSAGLAQKANDSLDMLFDTTACGEYKSFNGSQRGQSQLSEEEEDQEEEEEDPGNAPKLHYSAQNSTIDVSYKNTFKVFY